VAVRCQIRLMAHNTQEWGDMFGPLHSSGHEHEGTIVPPGDSSSWNTCYSGEVATDADLKALEKDPAAVKLTLYFEYFDTSRNLYNSKVCKYSLPLRNGGL